VARTQPDRTRDQLRDSPWRPGPLRLLVASQPSNGSVDTVHYLFHGEAAEHAGPPTDTSEAERIEWIPLSDVRGLIARGKIVSGPTLIGAPVSAGQSPI
jgi:hypothetical protein